MADPFPVTPANAPPASYTDFTAAQRSLYGAGMLPKLNIAIGPQLPGGAQEAARGAALSALPGMPPPGSPWNATKVPFNPGHGYKGPAPAPAPTATLPPGSIPLGNPYGLPTARAAPVSTATMSGGFTPAPRPADTIAPPILGGEPAQSGGYTPPGAASPNVIAGGLPQPAPLPPHPADYATWYASKLAENMQAGAEAGPQGGQGIYFVGPNSPPMEAPAHPAAVNVIRGGIPSGGGGDVGGGGMNLMQLEALKPFLLARQAAQLNVPMQSQRILSTESQKQYEVARALAADPTNPALLRAQAVFNSKAYQDWMRHHQILAGSVQNQLIGQNLPAWGDTVP